MSQSDGPVEWEITIKFPVPYFTTMYTAGGELTVRIPFDGDREAAEEALQTMHAWVRGVRGDNPVVTGEVVPEREMIENVSEPK